MNFCIKPHVKSSSRSKVIGVSFLSDDIISVKVALNVDGVNIQNVFSYNFPREFHKKLKMGN